MVSIGLSIVSTYRVINEIYYGSILTQKTHLQYKYSTVLLVMVSGRYT